MSPDRWSNWEWEQIADHDNLTEGPAWDGSGLLYNECAASTAWRFDPATGQSEVWREGTNGANGMVFDRQGRLFACEGAGRRIVRYEANDTIVIADRVDGKCFNEPNDLAIDSARPDLVLGPQLRRPAHGTRPRIGLPGGPPVQTVHTP